MTETALTDRVALITGATRGIGKAIALELGRMGATIAGTATSEEGAASISDYLQENGIKGAGFCMDVGLGDSVQMAYKALCEKFASPTLLISNAGITRDNLLVRMRQDEWDDVINTNLNAMYRLTKQCIRSMMKARWGRIIAIGSVVGLAGNPGQANYAATKAALVGFCKSLAYEVASRNITVNVVAPGFIDTDMSKDIAEEHRKAMLSNVPMDRLGIVDEVAYAVGALANPRASYITGETIHVNGGLYMA